MFHPMTGKPLVSILICSWLALAAALSAQADVTDATVLEPDALVDAVLTRNPDVAAVQAAWQAMQAAERGAGALADPMLGLSTAPLSLGGGEARAGYSIQLEQRLPFPGKRGLERESARERARRAGYEHDDLRLDLARMTARAFADYAAAHEALLLLKSQEELARETVTVAEALYTVGRVPQQEPLQAELEVISLEHDRIVADAARSTAMARINALLHREPDAALPPPAALSALRMPDAGPVAESHPRLRSSRAGIAANTAEESLARREYWPDVNLMAGYDNMWEMQEHRWMVGAMVNIPLQRSTREAAVDEARHRGAELQARLRSEEAGLAADLATAYHRAREAHHGLMLLEERTLPVARAQVEAARSAYEAGRVPLTALLDAQRSLWAFEERKVQAQAELATYLADYAYTRGEMPHLYVTQSGNAHPPHGDDQ